MSMEIVMPKAGLTMVEGTIIEWKVKEGAKVNKGDVLMEYENEKNTIEANSLGSGILHITAKEGETIPIGEKIGVLAEDQAEYDAIAKGGDAPAAAAPAAPAAAGEGVTMIPMPKAGLTMVEGTIIEWKVKEGDEVKKGDAVMEYENEKNTIDYEIIHGGFIHIVAKEGETVPISEPIAYVAETKAQYDAMVAGGAAPTAAAAAPAAAAPAAAPAASAAVSPASSANGFVRASGLARKMAKEAGVDLADIPCAGRVKAADVEAYLASRAAAPAAVVSAAPAAEDAVTEIPWVGVKKTIARNMLQSMQTTAQTTCMCDVDATELLAYRQKLVEQQEKLGCKISVNDILCKLLGRVLKDHPLANATFDGKTLYTHAHVQLSVAVATDNGLMVPVLRNADLKTLSEIHHEVKALAQQAKDKTLAPDAQSGGTCTITNVGMFPIDRATPVLNLPQTCIIGFGRPTLQPSAMPDGTVGLRQKMTVFATIDHQVIDGQECGRILKDIEYYILHPETILV